MKITITEPHRLFDPKWFTDLTTSQVWLRAYTIIGLSWEELGNLFGSKTKTLFSSLPVRVAFAMLPEVEFQNLKSHLVSDEDGKASILLQQITESRPKSLCLMLSTPFLIDGKYEDSFVVEEALLTVTNILTICFGKNLLRDMLFNSSVACDSGQMPIIHTSTNLPQQPDGPHNKVEYWEIAGETISKIESVPAAEKKAILFAFEMLARGIKEYKTDQRLSNAAMFYWMALESLAGGSGKVKSALKDHYRLKDQSDINDMFGIDAIREWRNNLVHNGIRISVRPELERYLQMLFFDVLQHRLRMKPVFFAKSYMGQWPAGLEYLLSRPSYHRA